MNRVQAVIFDWAGTTVDYGCIAPVAVFREVFKKRGIEITIEEARAPMGQLKKDHIRALCRMPRIRSLWAEKFGKEPAEEEIDELYQDFEPMLFDILPYHAELIPGVLPLVQYLREQGIKIGSTTGYTRDMINIVAEEARKKGYFPDYVVTPNEVSAGRPLPWMIFQNAMHLNVYPMSTIIKVGDTVSDIEEGVNAGVWTVGVIKGSSELGLTETEASSLNADEYTRRAREVADKMKAAGADFVIETINQLVEVIAEINIRLEEGY